MPTWAISSLEVTFFELFFSCSTTRFDRRINAALEIHQVVPAARTGAFA